MSEFEINFVKDNCSIGFLSSLGAYHRNQIDYDEFCKVVRNELSRADTSNLRLIGYLESYLPKESRFMEEDV